MKEKTMQACLQSDSAFRASHRDEVDVMDERKGTAFEPHVTERTACAKSHLKRSKQAITSLMIFLRKPPTPYLENCIWPEEDRKYLPQTKKDI